MSTNKKLIRIFSTSTLCIMMMFYSTWFLALGASPLSEWLILGVGLYSLALYTATSFYLDLFKILEAPQ